MKRFEYLKVFNSPFKRPKLKWYFGKIAIGTPYFYPRKTVKDPDKPGWLKFVPKKIGFDFVGLGYKIKWSSTDYRFEWAPLISFVFFKWQIAVIVTAPEQHHYWEAWLFYNRDTKGTPKERIEQCKEEFSLTYISHKKDGTKNVIDYYDLILKDKYK